MIRVEFEGGPDEVEVAAILAVVARVLEEQTVEPEGPSERGIHSWAFPGFAPPPAPKRVTKPDAEPPAEA